MSISAQRVVTLHYRLKDVLSDGGEQLLDDSQARDKPLEYLHGHDNILPGLEQALEGQEAGAELGVTLAPADAYGVYSEALVQTVSRASFGSAELSVGDRFQTEGEAGPQVVTVLNVDGDSVTVDTNHPLAGHTLRYQVKVLTIREATRAELAKGHPLPPGTEPSKVEDRKVL
ncbi:MULTISPECIES: FKBP-type peptidyl-prolyl cis-trans isomerase [unclassified Halomonas]|uniref:FKBP-type peptidyl-prolyl cis-trans isomerase n=1 Tax=unclassified Halomonas TaxID=2609666 RepID=UPI0006DB20F0|nr:MULTISPECIES: peptidylprolyl isomerase [unclassified Halomonas]KPQ30991.1 MAG: FKBP-type peptidyl-prolyl cis-trans isomerases 2 [Halomonas sp. HL-93]SBR49229.1 FKBP-type peptidyl-prolyl cis-trans isomerase SlyD [Halomonas sp. HL-93]SNY95908.1 FKBP-type peptidyl-prolyl cis-trans isomerase SlyD [Halomonas sp. hl-4]